MRVLITGIAGFAGRHLARLLLSRGDEVHGTIHRPESRTALAVALPDLGADRLHRIDVTEAQVVSDALRRAAPDAVIHLAGLTFVPDSHADPAAFFRANVLGLIHLLAAVRQLGSPCRIVAVGSAAAYGALEPGDLPVDESCPMRPLSPYGASKAAADLIAYQWARTYGLDVVRVRPFNHTGPGQRPEFVCPDFARQLAAIARREKPARVEVGNLDVVRDFSDVRDVVAAYVAALERGRRGEAYNVCSGVGHSIREMLSVLIELSGCAVEVGVAPERERVVDVPEAVGSFEKLRRDTGWSPRIEWRQMLADVYDEWRTGTTGARCSV
jgi:GDP-4-dehydro-6-deoxy-D-mannose reductase